MVGSSRNSALEVGLVKLIGAVEEENSALKQQQVVFHGGYTDRKNQALRELMAAHRREPLPVDPKPLRPMLETLSTALNENSRLLKLHISAVGEISDIIVASLKNAEWDGTYSRDREIRSW